MKLKKVIYTLIILFLVLNNPLFFVFIGLHEIGHLLCGIKLNYTVKKISLLPFGFSLCFKEDYIKPQDNIIISLFGPLTNLIFFLFFYLVYLSFPIDFFESLVEVNIFLLIFNLIPVGFLDGGRVLKEVLSCYVSFYLGNLIVNLNGIIFGCIMFVLSVYISSVISKIVFVLIGLSIICNSLIQIKWIKMNTIKEVLYKRFRRNEFLEKRKIKYYSEDTKVFTIIKNFCFNKDCSVVIKENPKATLKDADIVNFYFTKGNITLGECFYET